MDLMGLEPAGLDYKEDSMNQSNRRCTIVIPCYNEADRLPLASFESFFAQGKDFFFLFVNDGSKDDTLNVLIKLKAAYPDFVDVLDQPRNMGKAEAVRAGMLQAIDQHQSRFVGFWDADLATPLEELQRFEDLLDTLPGTDVVLGSRVRLLGRSVERKAVRHYSGRIFATLASMTLDLPIYDTQCGAKLFRVTPELRQMVATPFHSRWTFDVELLARFLTAHSSEERSGAGRIYEQPLLKWTDVGGSKLKVQDSFKALGDLIHIRRQYFRS